VACWLVVGLGNPGKQYSLSRHNIGFWAIENISGKLGIPLSHKSHKALWGKGRVNNESIILAEPHTFMNLSGISIKSLMDASAIPSSHLILIHDDMDLMLAQVRIRLTGGSGGHKGILSVVQNLATTSFIRIRIGIGRPDPPLDSVDFVLGNCSPQEKDALIPVIATTDEIIKVIIEEGPQAAMNRFNN
jgi:PTH1 family peptidyl-tRNA hydrolase